MLHEPASVVHPVPSATEHPQVEKAALSVERSAWFPLSALQLIAAKLKVPAEGMFSRTQSVAQGPRYPGVEGRSFGWLRGWAVQQVLSRSSLDIICSVNLLFKALTCCCLSPKTITAGRQAPAGQPPLSHCLYS